MCDLYCRSLFIPFAMRFTGSCHNWCMAAMGTLVTFLLYSVVIFYVVIIADSLHWILVTVHRYTLDSGYFPVYVRNN